MHALEPDQVDIVDVAEPERDVPEEAEDYSQLAYIMRIQLQIISPNDRAQMHRRVHHIKNNQPPRYLSEYPAGLAEHEYRRGHLSQEEEAFDG